VARLVAAVLDRARRRAAMSALSFALAFGEMHCFFVEHNSSVTRTVVTGSPLGAGGALRVNEGLSSEDIRAILLALMRIEEKLDELLGENDEDGEEEDLA
jgi:hypothetical protein